jgi:hypothetical protein
LGEIAVNHAVRRALTVTFCLTLLAGVPAVGATRVAGPATSAEAPVLHVELTYIAKGRNTAAKGAFVAPAPCTDRVYNLEGGRWKSKYSWSFRAASTPGGLTKRAAESAIRRGVANIATAHNDCGRPDRVRAKQSYLGRTAVRPSCGFNDGRNVVGFRPLAPDVAARACWWVIGNRIVEGDIQINSNIDWATSRAGCKDQLMLEAVLTHEAGHVFGLAHVGESRHGRLTMSPYIDGVCNNQESTLGLGDLRGLEALYP